MNRPLSAALAWTGLVLVVAGIGWLALAPRRSPAPLEYRSDASSVDAAVPLPVIPPSPAVARFLDRHRTVGERLGPDIVQAIPEVSETQDVAAVLIALHDAYQPDVIRHEAANLLRRSRFPKLTDELVHILRRPTERLRFRAFCAQQIGLELLDDTDAADKQHDLAVLRELLDGDDLGMQREALFALVEAGDGLAIGRLDRWLDDPHRAALRDLVIRCLGDLDRRDTADRIRAYALDGDDRIRLAALDVLGRWQDDASQDAFARASASASPIIHQAGQLGLARLASRGSTGVHAATTPPEPAGR